MGGSFAGAQPPRREPPASAPGGRLRPGRSALLLVAAFIVGGALLLAVERPEAGAELADILRGPDDFMRMVRVVAWLDGQPWGDPMERRLNPPHGVSMHWSRLSDVPLAVGILAAEPWVGRERALVAAVTVVPPLLGGALVAVFLWATAALVPGRHLPAALLALPALALPLRQFASGRVDHHGLQLLLLLLATGWLLRALPAGETRGPARSGAALGAAAAAGACLALSLAVGLETLPLAGAATAVVCAAWAWEKVDAAVVAAFGGVLAATSLALWPVVLPVAEWFDHPCDRLSLVHCALVGVPALLGAVAWGWERAGRPGVGGRLLLLCCAGGGGLLVVAGVFPQCAAGPLAGLDPGVLYWLEHVSEARSLPDMFAEPGTTVSYFLLPALGLAFAVWRFGPMPWRAPRGTAAAVLLAVAVAVMVWQIRGLYTAAVLAALVLAVPAAEVDSRARGFASAGSRVLVRLGMPLGIVAALFGPVLVERALTERPAESGGSCGVAPLLDVLNDPAGLGGRPRNIAAPIDVGPALLLFTGHRVLAGPYHRNVRGLVDNRTVFAGPPEAAREVIRERSVEALVYCRNAFSGGPTKHRASLDELLARDQPPAWLEQVAAGDGVRLYRVREHGPRGGVPAS